MARASIDGRAIAWAGAAIAAIAVVLLALRPKPLSASVPPPAPGSLDDTVQQERKAELAQWQIVQRNVQRLVDDRYGSPAEQQAYKDQLAEASSKIAGLEREIAAHGG